MPERSKEERLFGGRRGLACGVLATAFLMASCDPPGKPKGDEVQPKDVKDFATLYNTNCSGCHGAEGKYGPARILNDSLYLTFLPREELHKILVYGRQGGAMPAWAISQGGPLTDEQINILVDGIYKHWGQNKFNSHGVPIPPYSAPVDHADLAAGKKLFAKDCYMCHGPGAKVGVITSAAYTQLSSNQLIRTSIVVGRSDLGMPNYLYLNAGKPLSDADVTNLTAYVASFRPEPGPTQDEHSNDNGTGQSGSQTTGNSGSGNGPGSASKDKDEGHKHTNSSQSGGTIESNGKSENSGVSDQTHKDRKKNQ